METKQPMKIQWLKTRLVKVDPSVETESATADWTVILEVPARAVKNSSRSVHVGVPRGANIRDLNRVLRGCKEPVSSPTASEGELETA
jgi:hypothetical protein